MNRRIRTLAVGVSIVFFALPFLASDDGATEEAGMQLAETEEKAEIGSVEIKGVSAGALDVALWQNNTLHWVPDVRTPMLLPLPGTCRNIYAPSAVKAQDGWRMFYGAWDGTETGNDRIYSVTTKDFVSFENRHTVIEHGDFVHVCNVNAIQLQDGSFTMACTCYPDGKGLNKPAVFRSPDGQTWQGTAAPYEARMKDIVQMEGYDLFEQADINGMNVLLHEDNMYRLYFGNFKDFGKVYRASSSDGRNFQFDGVSLEAPRAVNDVKKFRVGQLNWYLMGLHMNCDKLWYALSEDGMNFSEAKVLGENLGESDRYNGSQGAVRDIRRPDREICGRIQHNVRCSPRVSGILL